MDETKAVHDVFSLFDDQCSGELRAEDVQAAHEMVRMSGISMAQVRKYFLVLAVIEWACGDNSMGITGIKHKQHSEVEPKQVMY